MKSIMTGGEAAAMTACNKDLAPDLFDNFIRFIDRGEQTTRAYTTNLRQFAAWMHYQQIRRPQRADIILYRQWLSSEHDAIKLEPEAAVGWIYRTDHEGRRYKVTCKPATVKLYLQSVRQFFKWTEAEGLYPNIAANVHGPRTRQDIHKKDALTPADVLTIEKSITEGAAAKEARASAHKKDRAGRIERAAEQGKRLHAMYLLAVTAGLRTIEISRANIQDIEVRGNHAVLWIHGKGHTEADARKPLAPAVYEAIRDYINTRSDNRTTAGPLFVSTGNRSGGKRIAPPTISKMLKKAMKDAGYNSERLTAHSLRHTTGTAVQELTGDLYATQRYMRHSNPATTEIYLHTDTETAEARIAQELYCLFHEAGGGADQEHKDGNRGELERLTKKLTPQQIEQLTKIATAMSR